MITQLLNEARQDDKLVCVYDDKDNIDRCSLGYVASLSADALLLMSIDPEGRNDGYHAIRSENIIRVETDSQYISKIKTLMRRNYTEHTPIETFAGEDLFFALLRFAKDNKYIVALHQLDDEQCSVQGFATDVNSVYVRVACVDSYGAPDGTSTMRTDDITDIVCNDTTEVCIKYLYGSGKFRIVTGEDK